MIPTKISCDTKSVLIRVEQQYRPPPQIAPSTATRQYGLSTKLPQAVFNEAFSLGRFRTHYGREVKVNFAFRYLVCVKPDPSLGLLKPSFKIGKHLLPVGLGKRLNVFGGYLLEIRSRLAPLLSKFVAELAC